MRDINKVVVDNNKAEKLFYDFKDLGHIVSQLSGVVQNPDFADTRDVEIFIENCKMFEKAYEKAKSGVLELFHK